MRFVHTADNHLDMPLSTLPQKKASIRKSERLKSFSSIIDYTKENADALIISGDLFHSPTPSASCVNFCAKEFERLGNIPVFISLGNHDYSFSSSHFPGNVHIFSTHFERFVSGGVAFTGASFAGDSANMQSAIPSPEPGMKNILILHGDLFGKSTYNPLDKNYLTSLGYDYVALGHVHAHFEYENIFYPGCHDGSGFDECGEKSFIYASFSPNLTTKKVRTSTRIYSTFDFDISSFTSSLALSDALTDIVSDGIYQINLTGTLQDGFLPNLDYIENRLNEKAFFATLTDSTHINVDLSSSSIYRLFSDYLSQNFSSEVAQMAYKFGVSALKGDLEDL